MMILENKKRRPLVGEEAAVVIGSGMLLAYGVQRVGIRKEDSCRKAFCGTAKRSPIYNYALRIVWVKPAVKLQHALDFGL